jgi:6-phosphogluconate dehydrogenase
MIKSANWIRLIDEKMAKQKYPNMFLLITVNCHLENVVDQYKRVLSIEEIIRKGGNSEYTYYQYRVQTSLDYTTMVNFLERFIIDETEYIYE